MHLVRTGDRVILASNADLALAEPLDGERTDDPPPARQAAILDVPTGELLGAAVWQPVWQPVPPAAWHLEVRLAPTARDHGPAVSRLLAEHLFATTPADRVETHTGGDTLRDLEKAGFRREGLTRGLGLIRCALLRADLEDAGAERSDAAAERAILAHRDGVVLAEALPGDREAVAAASDDAFDLDRDTRPDLLLPPPSHRAVILDADSYELLGAVSWHPVDYGGTRVNTAWNIGIDLVTSARGRGIGTTAQRLLAEHLFATTDLDRVEAGTDRDNVAEQRALSKAGFHHEGTLRGAQLRKGVRRDMYVYGILRTDLEPGTAP
jgi:hypothetical protein